MRQRQQQHHRPQPSVLLSAGIALLGAGLFFAPPAAAVPHPRDNLHDAGYGYLMPKDCVAFCGYANQYCCSGSEVCYTTTNGDGLAIAGCSTSNGGAGFAWYTTTWTETETFTSTISSHFSAATTAASGSGTQCVPQSGSGEIACGSICCASDQYCAYDGQCLANGVTTTITTNGQTITTQYSAPYRVTSGATITTTAGVTGTAPADSASATGNSTVVVATASHLSGGAIAGIVIGSIAGVALLLLLCACCLVRGLWAGLMALLGLGGKNKRRDSRRSETIIEEERYSRHGGRGASAHTRRDTHGGWFAGGRSGGRPSTVASRNEKKKKSDGAGLLGIGAAVGTLLLLLGLKRDNKRKKSVKTRSDVASSYMSYDSYTASSPSSASRRTRDTRDTRGTRTTRVSRPPSTRR